jgi:hypothetical protein
MMMMMMMMMMMITFISYSLFYGGLLTYVLTFLGDETVLQGLVYLLFEIQLDSGICLRRHITTNGVIVHKRQHTRLSCQKLNFVT